MHERLHLSCVSFDFVVCGDTKNIANSYKLTIFNI
jgi:hypothetical protein